jgi:hypothetical protein
MLGRIGAAIRAALAAMRTMVWKTVRIGDRLISMLVPGDPAPAMPAVEPVGQAAAVESMTSLRHVANTLVQGHPLSQAMEKSIAPLQLAWLRSMTRSELCKLILANDADIRGHLRGKPIKGLVPYDAAAIRDVAAARAKRPEAPRPPRRTLRAVLAEAQGMTLAEAEAEAEGHPLVA